MRPGRVLAQTGCVAALFVSLLIAGCGGGGSEADQKQEEAQVETAIQQTRIEALLKVKAEEQKRREENPGETLAPAQFTDALALRYESDREICKALGATEMASEIGIDEDSDPEEVAKAYAKSFSGEFHQPAYAGCLAGLE